MVNYLNDNKKEYAENPIKSRQNTIHSIMQKYVSQPATGEHWGQYEVAVWDEGQQQYVPIEGPYFSTEMESKDFARQLNEENEEQ